MTTKQKIIDYIQQNRQAGATELADWLQISRQSVHRHLDQLIHNSELNKVGKPPKVYYLLNEQVPEMCVSEDINYGVAPKTKKLLEEHFIYLSPLGDRVDGYRAFKQWCGDRGFSIRDYAKKYQQVWSKYAEWRMGEWIEGTDKLKDTFEVVYLAKLFYADFYSLEIFGRTKLGQLLLYAKQSQNKGLIREVVDQIKPIIVKLIDRYKIDALVYVPPSVKREVQFMSELKRLLGLGLPVLEVEKVHRDIVIPQKTLNKLSDRVKNAEQSLLVTDKRSFDRVLVIDDAIGSGATINEVAKKLVEQNVAKRVYGFAITGSAKGFDVISEI